MIPRYAVSSNEAFAQLRDQLMTDVILDPSILIINKFWNNDFSKFKKQSKVYFPNGLHEINEDDFKKYYGGYRKKRDLLSLSDTISFCESEFYSFDHKDSELQIPDEFSIQYLSFRNYASNVNHPALEIISDEAVFLLTKSSMASRLKKSLKIFEQFKMFPIINLEDEAPDDLKEAISGLKNFINISRWWATPIFVAFGPFGNPMNNAMVSIAIEGVRLLIIDP